ncbi:MAG: DUF4190 domain-containing protein [Acidimicrobiaceae bacterium]|nr:DUF4190 domain-containing protein [Acidimicrobiaceae bacterium]
MNSRPPSEPHAGIGEWPLWGDEPPDLWFRQVGTPPSGVRVVHGPPAEATPASPRLALPGFILGLLGACLAWIPVGGLGCAVFGVVLSIQARRAIPPGYRGRELPTAGLVLGCIGVAFGTPTTVVLVTIALNALFSAAYGG